MLEKYEIHDIPSFFFEGYESPAFIFSITNLKMFQAGSPWKGVVGGGGECLIFLFESQDLSPEHLQFILVTEAESCIDLEHWVLPVPYDPIAEKKKTHFLYLLDVHTS